MEQNTVNTTAVYEALQELENEVKDCMTNIEDMLSSCSTIENCYANFIECNGATLTGYPTTKSDYAGQGRTRVYTETYTFETTSSVDIADVSANIKKYLENANEELENLSKQITNGYSIMDEIVTYNKQVEDNLHMSFEEYSHLFDKNLIDHLWRSSDVVGNNEKKVKITDSDKQWWTDDNLAFEYNPSGNGVDAWIVYQVVDGKKVAMGWTDTKTAAAYSKEALNMLKEKEDKAIKKKMVDLAFSTAPTVMGEMPSKKELLPSEEAVINAYLNTDSSVKETKIENDNNNIATNNNQESNSTRIDTKTNKTKEDTVTMVSNSSVPDEETTKKVINLDTIKDPSVKKEIIKFYKKYKTDSKQGGSSLTTAKDYMKLSDPAKYIINKLETSKVTLYSDGLEIH